MTTSTARMVPVLLRNASGHCQESRLPTERTPRRCFKSSHRGGVGLCRSVRSSIEDMYSRCSLQRRHDQRTIGTSDSRCKHAVVLSVHGRYALSRVSIPLPLTDIATSLTVAHTVRAELEIGLSDVMEGCFMQDHNADCTYQVSQHSEEEEERSHSQELDLCN